MIYLVCNVLNEVAGGLQERHAWGSESTCAYARSCHGDGLTGVHKMKGVLLLVMLLKLMLLTVIACRVALQPSFDDQKGLSELSQVR